jgi:hypothetical protein
MCTRSLAYKEICKAEELSSATVPLTQVVMSRNPCHIVSVTLNHLDAMLAFATAPQVPFTSS